jgi:uncharacterized protein
VIRLQENAQGVTFAVRVQPRARRNAVAGEIGGVLKLSLTAPPVDGRANDACINFLAELLDVPRSSLTIISGQTSRNKVVLARGMTSADIRAMLGPSG